MPVVDGQGQRQAFERRKARVVNLLEAQMWLLAATSLVVDEKEMARDLTPCQRGELRKGSFRLETGREFLRVLAVATINGDPAKNKLVMKALVQAEAFVYGITGEVAKLVKELKIVSRFEAIQLRNRRGASRRQKGSQPAIGVATFAVAQANGLLAVA